MTLSPTPSKPKLCLLVFICLLLCSCNDEHPPQETRLRSVRFEEIHNTSNGIQRTFSGIAKASQEEQLSFKVSGTLAALPVEVGDHLQAGQLIAKLDAAQYQLEAQQLQATLAQAKASLRNALANFERVKRLYENNNISRNDLDSARAAAESEQAQLQAAEKSLQLARLKVSYTQLKTTKACDVAQVLVANNENVSSGQAIVLVTCGKQLEIELSVAESYIAAIQRDMPAQIRFSSQPGEIFAGRVTEVGVASTAGGSTYLVTVALTNATNGLRSGLAAEVSFEFSQQQEDSAESIFVPPAAVAEDTAGRFVYLVTPSATPGEGIIQRRTVSVGELSNDGLEILSGLQPGEKIVTAGVTVIHDGLRVALQP